ncbi:MAG: chorismate-binding protein, partial [Myxococcota bacterium]
PAVGGVPTAPAMAWIAERESEARGWYAAPVGWFDASGQGEFAVAIRSGLLCDRMAYLYAGAGIVRDSDPDSEFAETQLKQRTLLDALGMIR